VKFYFADTVFWIAISRQRDELHRRAIAWQRFIASSGSTIVTTEAVLWEWLNALSDPSARTLAANGYQRAHRDPQIEVVPFQPGLITAAVELYRARGDKDWSLTDCLSFVVMEHRGVQEALTTDRHFAQASLKPVMLEEPTA
jgi:uncharacterized protein